ncbi:MAG: carbohydrate-binding domain-containing protein, partial [Chitinophagaceae bacterium]
TPIYAVDYDLGRIGYAYYDIDSATYWVSTGKGSEWNKGRQYRNDGVDIDPCKDAITNGYAVTSMEKGEWLQYTVNSQKTGMYQLNIRLSPTDTVNEIGVSINGGAVKKLLIKPAKANSWKTFTINGIQLKGGKNLFRVEVIKGNLNLNYFQFAPQKETPSNNTNGGSRVVPTTKASKYNKLSEQHSYHHNNTLQIGLFTK